MKPVQKTTDKKYLNFYFQVHQPRRLRRIGFFDIGRDLSWFDDESNRDIIRRVAKNCYQPFNLMLLELIGKFPQLRITFSISGVALEQLKRYAPEVIGSFKMLVATGSVELLGETYYHSLASISNEAGFIQEVEQHRKSMEDTFGVRPSVFRNTELIYSDAIGRVVKGMGFEGMYADGVGKLLQQRSSGHVYEHIDGNGLKLLLRNYSLSDDIAFRFSNHQWEEWPLTPEKFTRWLYANDGQLIIIGLDYETFGEHQPASSGIFRFMKKVMTAAADGKRIHMVTASEALQCMESNGVLSSPTPVSWADKERDLSAWLGNDLQRDAFDSMRALAKPILALGDKSLVWALKHLETSDHFYYMSTKKGDDGGIHHYFSPYPSPYEAFINYMNVLADLALRIKQAKKARLAAKGVRFRDAGTKELEVA